MLGRLRGLIRPAVRVLAAPLARLGVPPLVVSLSAIPLALGAAVAIDDRRFAMGFALALLAALADLFDGAVADLQRRATPFGNYAETMIDKIVEVILIAGTARHCPLAACLACGTSLLVSFAKARVGLVIIADNRDWPAIGDRADRILVLLGGLALAALGYGGAMRTTLWMVVGLNLLGLVQRICFAHAMIARAERTGALLPYLRAPRD